jgi:hypothetical protein
MPRSYVPLPVHLGGDGDIEVVGGALGGEAAAHGGAGVDLGEVEAVVADDAGAGGWPEMWRLGTAGASSGHRRPQMTKCEGRCRVIACIEDPVVIQEILTHLGLPTTGVQLHLARGPA